MQRDHGQVNNGVDQQTTIINNMSESGLLIQIHRLQKITRKAKRRNWKIVQNSFMNDKWHLPALMRKTKIVVINKRFNATKVSLWRMHSFNWSRENIEHGLFTYGLNIVLHFWKSLHVTHNINRLIF